MERSLPPVGLDSGLLVSLPARGPDPRFVRLSVILPVLSGCHSANSVKHLFKIGHIHILYPALASRSDVHFHGLEEFRFQIDF